MLFELLEAIRDSDLDEVQRLVKCDGIKGVDSHSISESPLGIAVCRGNEEIVSLLLDRGADVNTQWDYGWTPLGAAVRSLRGKLISLLLDRGADVNSKGGRYGTALGVAAYRGNALIISLLLDRGANIDAICGTYGTALGVAAYYRGKDLVSFLLNRGANINAIGGTYGTALGVAVALEKTDVMLELLNRGANINAIGGEYGTALGVAISLDKAELILELLNRGADINAVGGTYGTALGVAVALGKTELMLDLLDRGADINAIGGIYGTPLGVAVALEKTDLMLELLDEGADVNASVGEFGTALGVAAHRGHKELVELLLDHGADPVQVGGIHFVPSGRYPTAVDVAKAGKADPDMLRLLHKAIEKARSDARALSQDMDLTHLPPFPMPFTGPVMASWRSDHSVLDDSISQAIGHILTPEQADIPCRKLELDSDPAELLVRMVGIQNHAVERFRQFIQNDIQYFLSQDFDFGLAYAAVRVGWKHFNEPSFDVATHRARWLKEAFLLDNARKEAIYMDSNGQELIESPYSIMPRRIWDLKSNRMVEFRMLHSAHLADRSLKLDEPNDLSYDDTDSRLYPSFWAITHSWTGDMKPVVTSINQHQWPVPLPSGISLEYSIRPEVLNIFGGDYVWLDVLCLRQSSGTHSSALERGSPDIIRYEEWKLDVPTIGNIYRAADRLVRYFNGLGMPFSSTGWDEERHWLRRAWTLQEIKTDSTTFNGGAPRSNGQTIILNTRGTIAGEFKTLRSIIRPILKLAASVDTLGGCSVYELTKEMAKRYASQPTDKVAGLFYLLRTTHLPTYDETTTDEVAWTRCFHVLPFHRKVEILFEFPHRGGEQQWFPDWKQLMSWPERNPFYEHASAGWSQNCGTDFGLVETDGSVSQLFISNVWAICHIVLHKTGEVGEYEIKIGDSFFGFYCPYVPQEPLAPSRGPEVTLAALKFGYAHNWVVCETQRKQPGKCKLKNGKEIETEIEVVKKIGVLRTDSSCELSATKVNGELVMKRMNFLFS